MDRGAVWHPDLVTGSLSEVLQFAARPASNTLGDLDVYRGRAPEALFPAPRGVPEVTVRSRWQLPGLVSEDLEFRSLHVPIDRKFRRRYQEEYRETQRVYARRIRPRSAGARPRLLYLHGYMQPETYIEEVAVLALMARRLDVEVIQMQFPYHGRRTPRASRFSGELYWTADLVRSVEALRQTLLDARTLLSILLAQDSRPVGVAGLSLGGALTASLLCLDERFAFAIPLIAHMDLAALVADAPVLGRMRRDLQSFGWGGEEFGAFVAAMGWYDLRPKLAAHQILVLAAAQDRFFDPSVVRTMWKQWRKPAIHWYPSSHMGFLSHLPTALRQMHGFLEQGTWAQGTRRTAATATTPRRRRS